MTDKVYLTTADLAKRWGMKPTTLRSWRCKKRGPPYTKPGGPTGEVRYKVADIEAWERTNTVRGEGDEQREAAGST